MNSFVYFFFENYLLSFHHFSNRNKKEQRTEWLFFFFPLGEYFFFFPLGEDQTEVPFKLLWENASRYSPRKEVIFCLNELNQHYANLFQGKREDLAATYIDAQLNKSLSDWIMFWKIDFAPLLFISMHNLRQTFICESFWKTKCSHN